MTTDVRPWLDKLEAAIDLDWEHEKIETYRRVLDFQPVDGLFDTSRCRNGAEPGDWPRVGVNEAIADMRKMLLYELGGAYRVVCRRSYMLPNIRCNYGTGCLPSLFGAEVFWMDDELDTLPTTRPLPGDDAIDRMLDAGAPDLNAGFGARIFETAEYFQAMLAPYPRMRKAVWLYHPDLQGPIDALELLWGSSMFYAFHDQAQKVHAAASLLCETYRRFLERWLRLVPPRGDGSWRCACAPYMAHWGNLYRGQVMLRDDSIVNLSPAMYREFVKPYDERLLAAFGGGAIHFCGRADHCIDLMTDSPRLTAVTLSQPHLNDMRRIYRATVGRRILLNVHPTDEMLRELDLSRGVMAR